MTHVGLRMPRFTSIMHYKDTVVKKDALTFCSKIYWRKSVSKIIIKIELGLIKLVQK